MQFKMPEKVGKYLGLYKSILKSLQQLSRVDSLQVGALIVNSKGDVLSMGYNHAALFTMDHEENYEMTLHAEEAALNTLCSDEKDLTMLITHAPCLHCTACIIASNVKKVFFIEDYKNMKGVEYLNKVGIFCQKIEKV